MFIAVLFTSGKAWKHPKCPLTSDRIKKMWYMYMMEYYSATEKNKTVSLSATQTELEMIILSEVSQREQDKYHVISLT